MDILLGLLLGSVLVVLVLAWLGRRSAPPRSGATVPAAGTTPPPPSTPLPPRDTTHAPPPPTSSPTHPPPRPSPPPTHAPPAPLVLPAETRRESEALVDGLLIGHELARRSFDQRSAEELERAARDAARAPDELTVGDTDDPWDPDRRVAGTTSVDDRTDDLDEDGAGDDGWAFDDGWGFDDLDDED